MNQNDEFSTENISQQLISRIANVIKNKSYGSVEIYIENGKVVQITERTITKIRSANGIGQPFNRNQISRGQRLNRFQLKIQKY